MNPCYFIPKFGENNKNALKKALQNNCLTSQLMKEIITDESKTKIIISCSFNNKLSEAKSRVSAPFEYLCYCGQIF